MRRPGGEVHRGRQKSIAGHTLCAADVPNSRLKAPEMRSYESLKGLSRAKAMRDHLKWMGFLLSAHQSNEANNLRCVVTQTRAEQMVA